MTAWLLLAVLALSVRLIVPQGFMASSVGAFPLTICTGHAETFPNGGPTNHDKAPATADHVCAFAGAHVLTPPDTLIVPSTIAASLDRPVNRLAVDLAPGRGLAAPPPPSQGPPVHLI